MLTICDIRLLVRSECAFMRKSPMPINIRDTELMNKTIVGYMCTAP